ncbi:MAG: rhomboid family intramembrane serine protease [Solirubrobacterales bacterium]
MAERELFVVCNNCGEEVSPYVTECPYCGHRLRKRAPDLKKAKKQEEKEEKRAEKKRARLRSQFEGGGEPERGAYLRSAGGLPIATTALIVLAVAVSLVSRGSGWVGLNLVFLGDLADKPWVLVTAPFVQGGAAFAFACLAGVAMFGAGIEARYGPVAVVLTWLVCGAFGILAESLLAPVPFSNGALAVAVGMLTAWLIVVVSREDLRDYDGIGLAAVGGVLLALPIATNEASIWTLVGGLVGGGLCGAVLSRLRARPV